MTAEPVDGATKADIVTPFDGASPAGEDLRLDTTPQSLYYRLRDARATARAEERAAENDPAAGEPGAAPWKMVHDLATEALRTRTKDIEIAAWLAESLTRRDGIAGLARGTDILADLITHFWDNGLHPSADDATPEEQLAAIGGLSGQERDGSLLPPLRKMVLFQREDGTPVTLWEYERSKELSVIGASGQKPQKAAAAIPAFADLEATAQTHGRPALLAIGRGTVQALAAWQTLEDAIARVASADAAPATGRVKTLLDSLRRTVELYVPASELAPDEPRNAIEPHSDAAATKPQQNQPAAAAPLSTTRDGMLDQVLQIADTFRRIEPNSPFSYTLEEAVRRARLAWPDLLREMIPDLSSRTNILSGLGIRPPPQ